MSKASGNDRIDDVTPGDIIAVDRGSGAQPYKVVFKDPTDAGYLVTLESDRGETFSSTWPPAPRWRGPSRRSGNPRKVPHRTPKTDDAGDSGSMNAADRTKSLGPQPIR